MADYGSDETQASLANLTGRRAELTRKAKDRFGQENPFAGVRVLSRVAKFESEVPCR